MDLPAVYADCVSIIEWPIRFAEGQAPTEHLSLTITIGEEGVVGSCGFKPSSLQPTGAARAPEPEITIGEEGVVSPGKFKPSSFQPTPSSLQSSRPQAPAH